MRDLVLKEGPYSSRTAKSREMFERAKGIEPAGISYRYRYFEPYPFFVREAHGSKLTDLDGNEFTDYWCTHFAMILGHAFPTVAQAIKIQVEKGWHYGLAHQLEVELSEKITRHVPTAQMVRFTSSGTEAALFAIRLARTFTERTKVAKFEGGWHGPYDPLHIAVKPPFNEPLSGGITDGSQRDTIVAPYNDFPGFLERVKNQELACVILEPLLGAGGMIPAEREFLNQLREYCTKTGCLLIFDEIITGFRLGLSGGQGYFNIKPDITILGKIIGGGLPIGAICGRRDMMERMDHKKYTGTKYAYHGGTFAANALSAAAGLATIDVLEHVPVYREIDRLGQELRRKLDEIFDKHSFPAQTTGIGSMFAIHTTDKRPIKDVNWHQITDHVVSRRMFSFLLDNGILLLAPDGLHGSISYSHRETDIDRLVDVVDRFIKELV